MQKPKGTSDIFLEQLVDNKVVCSCTKLHNGSLQNALKLSLTEVSEHFENCERTEERNSRKSWGIVVHYQTTRGSRFNKSSPKVIVATIVWLND